MVESPTTMLHGWLKTFDERVKNDSEAFLAFQLEEAMFVLSEWNCKGVGSHSDTVLILQHGLILTLWKRMSERLGIPFDARECLVVDEKTNTLCCPEAK